jgi:uncharacterized small protein (DUF1192 family)
MKKTDLIAEIDAYAAAKASGNQLLLARSVNALQSTLALLPDEIAEVKAEPPAKAPVKK